jgi:hypothetical protein
MEIKIYRADVEAAAKKQGKYISDEQAQDFILACNGELNKAFVEPVEMWLALRLSEFLGSES